MIVKYVQFLKRLPLSILQEADQTMYDQMLIYNREQEELRKEKERREQEWQEELESSMNMSDPTGHGTNINCSNISCI